MSTEDAMEYYNDLAQILRENELAWIVHQVENDIRAGKPEDEVASVPREQQMNLIEWRGVEVASVEKKQSFTRLREYTPQEMLELLIDATERAVCGIAELESAILRFDVFGGISDIVLAGEADSGPDRSLDTRDVAVRHEATQHLENALASIRNEIRNGR